MKKYLQIFAVLIVFSMLVIAKQSLANDGNNPLRLRDEEQRIPKVSNAPISTVTPRATPITSPAATPTTSQVVKGNYKDGAYIGSVADAYYGYIQVQAIITNGKLADVKFLQYPNDNRTSIQINTEAMPYLKQEAIQAQSANVRTVSGASDSSIAFKQSLQVALNQAK